MKKLWNVISKNNESLVMRYLAINHCGVRLASLLWPTWLEVWKKTLVPWTDMIAMTKCSSISAEDGVFGLTSHAEMMLFSSVFHRSVSKVFKTETWKNQRLFPSLVGVWRANQSYQFLSEMYEAVDFKIQTWWRPGPEMPSHQPLWGASSFSFMTYMAWIVKKTLVPIANWWGQTDKMQTHVTLIANILQIIKFFVF